MHWKVKSRAVFLRRPFSLTPFPTSRIIVSSECISKYLDNGGLASIVVFVVRLFALVVFGLVSGQSGLQHHLHDPVTPV